MRASRYPRVAWRLARLAGILIVGSAYYLFLLALRPGIEGKLSWMQWMSCRFLCLLGAKVRLRGKTPSRGLIVCNHLSYVDILVIGSVCPAVFVAKLEVRSWPVFGCLATMAGTTFVERGNRHQIRNQLLSLSRPLSAGVPLVLFPEGTSSDGSQVLPFRSSLLEAALATDSPVTPASLAYEVLGDGAAATDICYWGKMVFAWHLLGLLALDGFEAFLCFDECRFPFPNRKEEAAWLHARIRSALLAGNRSR